ncbi:MAG: tRNA (adenosine(37)-N6)-threonylcarbamoyltransferase complex dimerization subunit type 1 TsaB [Halanaerobiales bacterium]
MLTLGIDSSGEVGAVGLADGNNMLGEINIDLVHRHSEELLNNIDYLIKQTGTSIKEIEGLAVTLGPGSFTGLRIGLSTVKTFAQVLKIPVIGISTLDSLAYNLNLVDNWLVPMIDAKRNRIYTSVYKKWNQDIVSEKYIGDQAVHIEEFIEELTNIDPGGVFTFVGNAAIIYSNVLEKSGLKIRVANINTSIPRGGAVAELGSYYLRNGRSDNYLELLPNYLKKPQAEINWLKKHGKGEVNA